MRVFSQVGKKLSARLAQLVPEVEVVEVPVRGGLPDGLCGEVLLTQTWGSENLGEVLRHGVRWIHTLGTGVDRFPFDVIEDQIVTCSRGASAIPIAEYVLAVMLAFEKQLPDVWMTGAPERWYGARLGGLYRKKLALVGLGAIGLAVAERALVFGMEVGAVRQSDAPSPLAGVRIAGTLAELVRDADHIVVAASATTATRHLIDDAVLSAVKEGVHLINIARGSLVDQEALRRALDDGRVARASLDTVDPEPLPEGHWLYSHPSVRITPHVSWSMPGATELLLEKMVFNLHRYRAGEPLDGAVDRDRGY
jgi:phosphoglycerate dehydrogenase-like enzyme